MGSIDGNGKIQWKSKSRESRGCGLGAGPCEGIRASQLSCGLGLGDALQLPKEGLAGVVRLFQAPEASIVRRMRGGAASDHFGHLARVQVELFASANNRDTAEMAKKVMKKLKDKVEKKGLILSVTENGEEGKSKMIASCGFLENELRQFSREEGVALADSGGLWAST